jgi:hypothetical protein
MKKKTYNVLEAKIRSETREKKEEEATKSQEGKNNEHKKIEVDTR